MTSLFNSSSGGLAVLGHSEPEIHLRFAFITLLLSSTVHFIFCMSKEKRLFRDTFPHVTLPRWTTFNKGSAQNFRLLPLTS